MGWPFGQQSGKAIKCPAGEIARTHADGTLRISLPEADSIQKLVDFEKLVQMSIKCLSM